MQNIFRLLFLFVGLSWQQKDPLNDFCRRFGHQSAVVDEKLYLDGGFVNWNPIAQNNQNYTSQYRWCEMRAFQSITNQLTDTWLLYNDLTTSPVGVGVPQLHANLSKNATIPDVSGGILWADDVNKRFYLYGGDYNGISPNTPNLLSYDVIYDQWEYFGPPNMAINSVSWGGGVGISVLGQGYMLGGWLSNASVPGWSGGPIATSTLIKYQMDTGVWTNNTGPDTTARAEGVMVYLPASNNGLLVYFGGVTAPYNNATIVEVPMSTIYIYDIASAKWYTQTATGDVPLARRRFCAGAAWAPDQTSYNIYLYGGLGFGKNATGFDDVYILSLPSFQWVKWWEGSGVGKPHNSLTCNVVNKGQMLITGGTFPLSQDCDSPPTWGTHNLDLGKQTGKMWTDYQLNITSYVVPSEIIAVVGGSSLGGATATAPSGGFDNNDLSVYFTQHASVASRSPTRAIPTPTPSNTTIPIPTHQPAASKELPIGAIVGIAVGGAVILLALSVAVCCLIRRRKRPEPIPPQEMYSARPNYSEVLHAPPSQYNEGQYHQTAHYQLQASSRPAELSGNEYQIHQVDPKDRIIQVNENQHPTYEWSQQQPSSTIASPHPSTYSGRTELSGSHTAYGSQTSPAPTYSSTGRASRKPVPLNETYYSP